MFKDVISLIEVEKEKNSSGGFTSKVTSEKTVLAEGKSTRQSEFYQAMQVDLRVIKTFVIYSLDYNEERVIKSQDDKYYTVVRTYENGEFIELSCQRRLGLFEEAVV